MSKIQSTTPTTQIISLLRGLIPTEEKTLTDNQVLSAFWCSFTALKGDKDTPGTKNVEAARIEPIVAELLPLLDACSVDSAVHRISQSVKPSIVVLTPCNPLHKTVEVLTAAKCNLSQLKAVLSYRMVNQAGKTLEPHQVAVLADLLEVDSALVPVNWEAYENWLIRKVFGGDCTVMYRPRSNNESAIADALAVTPALVPAAEATTILFATFGSFEDKVKKVARELHKNVLSTLEVALVQDVPPGWSEVKGTFFGDPVAITALFGLQDFIRANQTDE